MVTNTRQHTAIGRRALKKKAEIIRGHRGAVAEICREIGKSHTLVSLALDQKLPDMGAAWLKPVLEAIDRKVAEILAAGSSGNRTPRKGHSIKPRTHKREN